MYVWRLHTHGDVTCILIHSGASVFNSCIMYSVYSCCEYSLVPSVWHVALASLARVANPNAAGVAVAVEREPCQISVGVRLWCPGWCQWKTAIQAQRKQSSRTSFHAMADWSSRQDQQEQFMVAKHMWRKSGPKKRPPP